MIQNSSQELVEEYFPGLKSLSILRLDLPDAIASGNKSYKLKYHIDAYRMTGEASILSFGGAFSNHIAALAYAGKVNTIPTIGVIRGEELNKDSNPVLKFASDCGMKLHFVSREFYRHKSETSSVVELTLQFGKIYVVPEGGGGDQGVRGCLEILTHECDAFDEIVLPVGTGTTLAGIIQTAKAHQHVSGIAVVADTSLQANIQKMIREEVVCNWNLHHEFTLGGYANTSGELTSFIHAMNSRYNLPLDHVYSGKALFALHRMARAGSFEDKKVIFLHTGGYAFVV